MSAELKAYADSLRRHIFIDAHAVDVILNEAASGKISDADARRNLRELELSAEEGPFYLSARAANEEWSALLSAMDGEAEQWQRIARSQFTQGFLLLPVAVGVIIAVLIYLAWALPSSSLSLTADPLLGACLAAVAIHAFLVFRVHQQARVAAERLSEKRAAILFLRLAIGRTDPEEVAQLLQAGTAMFLGHHAISAVPLQPGDMPTFKPVPAQRR